MDYLSEKSPANNNCYLHLKAVIHVVMKFCLHTIHIYIYACCFFMNSQMVQNNFIGDQSQSLKQCTTIISYENKLHFFPLCQPLNPSFL